MLDAEDKFRDDPIREELDFERRPWVRKVGTNRRPAPGT